jgi:signal transduction histidine kinase
MARLWHATPVRTLARAQGFAGLRATELGYKVRRTALAALAVSALIGGLSATSVALDGYVDPGYELDPDTGIVLAVARTSFLWRDGVRPGHLIVSTIAEGEPGGWSMVMRDPAGNFHRTSAIQPNDALAKSLPIGLASLALGGLAVLLLSTRRRWVVPVAALALLLAADPINRTGGAQSSTVMFAAAALVPSINLVRRTPVGFGLQLALAAGLLAFIGVWAVARLTGAPAPEQLEGIRDWVAFWGTIALFLDRAIVPFLRGESIGVMRPRAFDVVVIAAAAAIGFALFNLRVDPFWVGLMLLTGMAVLPSTRQRFGVPIGEAIFGDVRESAAAEAAEAERARLARELHDVPLQELVAVIRRLEIKPGTEAESEDLRALAGHLRNVATELRPPVLDDLGLPAALDYLAEESTTLAMPVVAEVLDDTGFGAAQRPPGDVELAMYRIASEAVGNAVRHSGGSRVSIRGSVAPGRVQLTVADDGAGLTPDVAREAAKRKHMGLASMRRRAQAIDAELSIDGSATGTQVRVAWQA